MSAQHKTGKPKPDRTTKLVRAAHILRDAILTGEFKPGQQLKQQEIAEQMGMSSTPIREILRRLEAEGLVIHIPRKGVFVSEMTAAQYRETVPIRAALETLAIRQASGRLGAADFEDLSASQALFEAAWRQHDLSDMDRQNYRFHMRIYEAAGSPMLCELIRRIWPRFATDLLWIVPGRAEVSIEQHRGILAALQAGDTEDAARRMAEHITQAGEMIGGYIAFQQQNEGTTEGILSGLLDRNE